MLGVALAEVGLAGLHHLFQRLADAAVGKVAPPRPGCGEDAVTVCHEGRQGEASAQHLGVLHRHPLQLPHRGVLLKDDLAVAGGEDLEGVAAADTLGAADLLRDDHPAQLIDAADDSGCFHLCTILPILHFPMLCSYYVEAEGKYTPARPVFAKQGRL